MPLLVIPPTDMLTWATEPLLHTELLRMLFTASTLGESVYAVHSSDRFVQQRGQARAAATAGHGNGHRRRSRRSK